MHAKSDFLSSLGILALIAVALFLTTTIDLSFSTDLETFTGPRAYPRLLLGLALVFNAVILVRAGLRLRDAAPARPASDRNASAAGRRKAAAAAVALIVFVATFEPVGYILAMAPLLVVISLLFGARRKGRAVAVTLAMTIVCLLAFRFGLNTVLPEGVLGIDMLF